MNNNPKKGFIYHVKEWLPHLYYAGALISFILILAQVYFAKRSIIQSSEWEKAKLTIENIERFKENLTHTALYGKTEALTFSDRLWPDFSTSKGLEASDTLREIYWSLFEDHLEVQEDFRKALAILDAFAYPIIMGYANEFGSFQSVISEFYSYSNYIMHYAFGPKINVGQHAKLLYKLWRIRTELQFLPNMDNESIMEQKNNLLYYEGTEVTPASLKQYEKKLEKELKKIRKEIEVFRKNSMK